MNNTVFWSDKEVASELRMSVQWVRQQRWLRRRGDKHLFTLDPIMIGKSPRYKREEVLSWIESLDMRGE